MSLRFLLGVLSSGLPEEYEEYRSTQYEINKENTLEYYMSVLQNAAKFHIGMLTISLLLGIAYGGYTAYICWMQKNALLGYIRNLVIALTCRTFFSIIFDGAIILGSPFNVGGGNFLLSIEQICLNLVIAFWLTLNIYLHERVQRNFNNEPTLMIYQFGVPGVALFFAFVWIFTYQDQLPNIVWWTYTGPFSKWVVNSVNLLYLLIQLGLLANIVRAMMKITLDNDAVSLLRKISAMMGVLILIFWLQFGLSIGHFPFKNAESYLYFFYLIDGLECGLICLVLYFFNKWVLVLLNKDSSLLSTTDESTRTSGLNEILITGDRGIVTIDSMFVTRESGRWKNAEEEGSKDVVYSSVIEPDRLKKTLDLYKRLNIIPTTQVTTVEGEEFFDCQLLNFDKRSGSQNSNLSKSKALNEDKNIEKAKVGEKKQKRNAFYSSKYLVLDSKEDEDPKFLRARPSVSSMSGKDSVKNETINQEPFSDLMSHELVRKWLHDNSENMQKKKAADQKTTGQRKSEIKSSSETDRRKSELVENMSKQKEDQPGSQGMIFSAINSVVSSVFFGSKVEERVEGEIGKSDSKPDQPHGVDHKEKETGIPVVTDKKSEISTVIDSRKKSDFDDKKVIGIEDNDKKDFKREEPQVNEAVPIEYPSELDKPPVLPGTKVEANQNSDTSTKEGENSVPTRIESCPKDDQRNHNEKLPSIEPKVTGPRVPQEDLTPGKSADDFKYKSELPILGILDDTLEMLKNKQSLSQSVSELKEESELDKSPDHNITYEELLEYRSQRDKSVTDQPAGVSKKLFDFSEALTSTIGSLISAGTSFFTTGRNSESVLPEIERKEKEKRNLEPKEVLDTADLQMEIKHEDTTSADLNFRNDTGDKCHESESSKLTFQTDSLESTETAMEVETNEDLPNASGDFGCIQPVKNTEVADINLDTEKHSELVIPEVESNEEVVEKNLKLAEIDLKLQSKQNDINQEINFINDVKNKYYEAEPSNGYDQPNFTFQMRKTDLAEITANNNELSTAPLSTVEQQLNKDIELAKTTEVKSDSDYQSEIRDITKKESSLKKKRKKNNERHKTSNKKFRNSEERSIKKIDSNLPEYVRLDEDSQEELPENHRKTVLSTKEPGETEPSSDSEFSIEKKRDSTSSNGSFSVDQYYSQLMQYNEKFKKNSNSVNKKQNHSRN